MSTDPSRDSPSDAVPPAGLYGPDGTLPSVWGPVRPPKFQHRYGRHVALFLATLVTTSLTPVWMVLWGTLNVPLALSFVRWPVFLEGLWYSLPVLAILSAHEFGHYFACRYHDVDATLPYFLPAPMPLTGTLGAVIRIREAFPSKRALFDIGVAGPLAGFVVLVPLLFWGLTMSHVGALQEGSIWLGEPLLFKLASWMVLGRLQEGMEVYAHPVAIAAWWGMLATALNLLPFGQLDGGHIAYASLGRRAHHVSLATLGTVVVLSFVASSWTAMAIMLSAMAFFLGFRHPRIVDEHEPLDPGRQAIALSAAIVFVICFTPIPIQLLEP